MRSTLPITTLLVLSVFAFGCDSAGNNDDKTPLTPNNVITGFYVVLEAPAGSTISYKVHEYNEFGTAIRETDPVVVQIESSASRVIDLFAAGADPQGVAVTAKMTAGSGTLKMDLYKNNDLATSAQTSRLNAEIYVNGGTAPSR